MQAYSPLIEASLKRALDMRIVLQGEAHPDVQLRCGVGRAVRVSRALWVCALVSPTHPPPPMTWACVSA